MQAQITAVAVCCFLLVTTYFFRRRSLPVKWRFLIFLFVDMIAIIFFIIVYSGHINLIILSILIILLILISIVLHVYERRKMRESETKKAT
jgi:hypothetical protein